MGDKPKNSPEKRKWVNSVIFFDASVIGVTKAYSIGNFFMLVYQKNMAKRLTP
jgi:hypothetical protein